MISDSFDQAIVSTRVATWMMSGVEWPIAVLRLDDNEMGPTGAHVGVDEASAQLEPRAAARHR